MCPPSQDERAREKPSRRARYERAHGAEGESAMLRITIYERPQETSFLVEGRLVGRWVKALEKCWEIGLTVSPSNAVLVTLSLTALDGEGRDLLTRMRRQGGRLES